MSKRLQVYYTAVLGALGGLLGWWSVGSIETTAWLVWAAYVFAGAGLGSCIAGCIAATDGALVKRSPRRALADGLLGALAGALLGALGLLVAGAVFLLLGGGFVGRGVGWMLLGAAIGLSDLAIARSRIRALHGALGGALGGLAGGALYEALTRAFLDRSDQAQVILGGVGLVVVGACIGALIPLARQIFAAGEVRVLSGPQQGLVREVTDTATIGRSDGCDLPLPDGTVAWRHAVVRRTEQGFRLEVLPGADRGIAIGALTVMPGAATELHGGERFKVGATDLEFIGRP
jgi:hypothetical protein